MTKSTRNTPPPTDGPDAAVNLIPLEQLRAWVAVYETRNLRKAAERLGVSAVTVQNRCNGLGDWVERLHGRANSLYTYDASSRRILPTDYGERLYEAIRSAIADLEGLPVELRRLGSYESTLRVCAPESLLECGLFEQIGRVVEGRAQPKMDVLSRGSEGGLNMLLAHECQIAFVSAYTIEHTHLTERFETREYCEMPVQLYVPFAMRRKCERAIHGYRKQSGPDGTREALAWILANFRLILPGDWSAFRQYVDALFAEHGLPLGPDAVSEFDSTRVKLQAMRFGFGAALAWAEEDLVESGVTAAVSLKGLVPPWRYLAVYHKGRLSETAERFLDQACGPAPRKARRH